jgi:hypothetical protein
VTRGFFRVELRGATLLAADARSVTATGAFFERHAAYGMRAPRYPRGAQKLSQASRDMNLFWFPRQPP